MVEVASTPNADSVSQSTATSAQTAAKEPYVPKRLSKEEIIANQQSQVLSQAQLSQ